MTNHNSDEFERYRYETLGPIGGDTPPVPPKKKRKALKIVGITFGAVVAIIIFGGVMAAGTGATVTKVPTQTAPNTAPTETATAPAPPAPTPAPVAPVPSGPATTFTDGTYHVGVDIAPGRYKTAGAGPSSYGIDCYTERESNDSGEFSAIIANNNTTGPFSVTVKKGEFFKAQGCQLFTKVG